MLAFLDALCAALLAHNSIEIFRLLALPRARKLPRGVREEAIAVARRGDSSHMAPIKALHLYYKLSHLVDESADMDAGDDSDPPAEPQMEFPLFQIRRAG